MPTTHEKFRAVAVVALLLAALSPVAAMAETLVIDGGTIHPVSGAAFIGRVVVEDGLITAAGAGASIPAGARRIDASGLHVYPGMFDALSQLGLLEVSAVAATDDQAEMGAYNPHLKAATAIHPASEVIPIVVSALRRFIITPSDSMTEISCWPSELRIDSDIPPSNC